MKSRFLLTASLLLAIAFDSAGQSPMTRQQYIDKYKPLAVEARDLYGIPASVTMAQALLESDNGNSRLTVLANNHFGIKCKSTWTGATISHDDDAPGECFRSYSTAEDSYLDHSLFLQSSSRYASLFQLSSTDYQGWAYGLKNAGYATNPNYALNLIKIIEDNQLFLLDDPSTTTQTASTQTAQISKAPSANKPEWGEWVDDGNRFDPDNYIVSMQSKGGYSIYANNGSSFVKAKQGDTFESIAGCVSVPAPKLRKFNELPATAQPAAGDMVYIKVKGRMAENGNLIHIVEQGETMRSVAQHYGIKIKSLASMNMRSSDSQLSAGQQLRLR